MPLEELYEELYKARMMFDHRRQPTHGVDLGSFDAKLATLDYSHPYEMAREIRATFDSTFRGFSGEPSGNHLYRLDSLKRILDRDGVERKSAESPDRLFAKAQQEYAKGGEKPLPLTWLLGGVLKGLRAIDFWTDFNVLEGDVERKVYRLGLPRDYLPRRYPIILLCPCHLFKDNALPIRVPTALDGYEHGPFFATSGRLKPSQGHALDLYDPDNLKPGAPEFVTTELPVEELSFVPVDWELEDAPERRFVENPLLISKLRDFFKKAGP